MHPARRPPAPRPAPFRALAPVGVPITALLDCRDCGGTGFVAEDGVRWPCEVCDSNGKLHLRIVAGRPEWHAELYPDMGEAGGFFVLIDGRERELAYCRTLEDAKAGEWFYWPLEEHAEVLAAMGLAVPGVRR